jgi:OOP family OmpA-OmpF porin
MVKTGFHKTLNNFKMKSLKPILFLLFICLGWTSFAQKGDEYFEQKDYYNAARYYEVEAENDASKYLNLGKSYFAQGRIAKAIEALNNYKSRHSSADIDYINSFIELLERDDDEIEMRDVPSINTSYEEYSPIITKDGKTLHFAAEDLPDGEGGYDAYFVEKQSDGTWGEPQSFDVFNSSTHEGLLAINGDEDVIILFGNYPGSFGGGDIFYSIFDGDTWSYPCNVGATINTDNWEAQANLSQDGKFLFFVSDRNGGQGPDGSTDIYVTEITNEGWTKPVNLGPVINSKGSEYTPFLAADNKTLYFASTGHFGFGGRDLFVSRRLDDSWTNWSEPVNMGKFINTIDDDEYFTLPASGTRGFIVRPGGLLHDNSDDIFEFIIPPSLRPETLINVYGEVMDENDSAAAVLIRYYDQETGEEIAKTASRRYDGQYGVSLPANKVYDVIIDMKGFLYYQTELDLTDLTKYFPARSFKEVLGDNLEGLEGIKVDLDGYGLTYDQYMNTGKDGDIPATFDNFFKLSERYDIKIEELKNVIKEARYEYLTELENQREIEQDHDVQRIVVGAKFEIKNIFFDFGKATLTDDSKQELDKLYEIMNRSEMVIEFGGHTDNVGSDEANQRLSQERVNSVKQYIADKGINPARMSAVGYGETQPVASNETDEGRQQNRRVELKITSLRLEREGQDELTGDEDLDGIREDLGAQVVTTDEVDLLELFRNAAEAGGLPEGASCNPEETPEVTTSSYTKTEDKGTRKSRSSSFDFGNGKVDPDNYIFKSFNPYVANFGYANRTTGDLGAGVVFMKKANLREWHLQYNFSTADGIKWSASTQWLFAIQTGLPVNLHYGIELFSSQIDGGDNPDGDQTQGYLNIPVGLRYNFNVGDIILAPDAFISFQALASDGMPSSRYFRAGINARWKLVQGGIFYNTGDFVKYTGLRAGLAF